MVPLGAMIVHPPLIGSEFITRYNLYPRLRNRRPAPGFSSGEALDLMEQSRRWNLPPDMGFDWTGLSFQEKLIGNTHISSSLLSIRLVFLVLAAQYESWTEPAAVILAVPMALVGVMLALIVRALAERPLYPDRARVDDRAGCKERDPDRRVRPGDDGGRGMPSARPPSRRRAGDSGRSS